MHRPFLSVLIRYFHCASGQYWIREVALLYDCAIPILFLTIPIKRHCAKVGQVGVAESNQRGRNVEGGLPHLQPNREDTQPRQFFFFTICNQKEPPLDVL